MDRAALITAFSKYAEEVEGYEFTLSYKTLDERKPKVKSSPRGESRLDRIERIRQGLKP
jgi:hypothetical protein